MFGPGGCGAGEGSLIGAERWRDSDREAAGGEQQGQRGIWKEDRGTKTGASLTPELGSVKRAEEEPACGLATGSEPFRDLAEVRSCS